MADKDFPVRASATKTILVAADDQGIRALAERILATKGYTVLSAGNADEALAIASDTRQTTNLLVVDHDTPRLNGTELLSRLRSLRPDVPAVLIAGDPASAEPARHETYFIPKPFDVTAVRSTRSLDSPGLQDRLRSLRTFSARTMLCVPLILAETFPSSSLK